MGGLSNNAIASTTGELEPMHALYRRGGEERQMAPHIGDQEPACPHPGWGEPMQAVDFRREDHGRASHDPLARAWWNDTDLAGRCPHRRGWIHFTIRSERAVNDDGAAAYPHLPDDWHQKATVLWAEERRIYSTIISPFMIIQWPGNVQR